MSYWKHLSLSLSLSVGIYRCRRIHYRVLFACQSPPVFVSGCTGPGSPGDIHVVEQRIYSEDR